MDELDEYLASSGDSDEGDENAGENGVESDESLDGEEKRRIGREKLRALLQSGDDSDADHSNDKDMEITFNTGLEDLSKRILEKKDKKSETVWEAVLRKRSEKKTTRKRSKYSSEDDSSDYDVQEAPDQPDDFFAEEEPSGTDTKVSKKNRKELSKTKGKGNKKLRDRSPEMEKEQEASKAELELLLADDQGAEHGPKGYNLKPKKVKGKKGKEKEKLSDDKLPSVNVADDPRFSALLTSHHFAVDPTDPQFKRSAAYIRQRQQKQQSGAGEEAVLSKEAVNPLEQVLLLPDNTVPAKDDSLDPTGVSLEREKHEFSSTIRSLKRNLNTLKKISKGR